MTLLQAQNNYIDNATTKESNMTIYTAAFADGTTITRNSDRAYTAARRPRAT